MFQQMILIGNLGSDVELRHTANDLAVANFSVATNEKWGQGDHTEWHRVVAWGKQAESCEKFLKKGSKVSVTGRIRTREWEDREGVKKYTAEIHADRVMFLDSSSGNGNRNPVSNASESGQERQDGKRKGSSKSNNKNQKRSTPSRDDVPF